MASFKRIRGGRGWAVTIGRHGAAGKSGPREAKRRGLGMAPQGLEKIAQRLSSVFAPQEAAGRELARATQADWNWRRKSLISRPEMAVARRRPGPRPDKGRQRRTSAGRSERTGNPWPSDRCHARESGHPEMKGAEGWTGAVMALGPRVRGGDSAGWPTRSSGLGDLGRHQADWKWRRNGLKRLIPRPEMAVRRPRHAACVFPSFAASMSPTKRRKR